MLKIFSVDANIPIVLTINSTAVTIRTIHACFPRETFLRYSVDQEFFRS